MLPSISYQDLDAEQAAAIVSGDSGITHTGIADLSCYRDNDLGVLLVGSQAIGSMAKWVRADAALAVLMRHGVDVMKDASSGTGIAIKTLQNAATTAKAWPYQYREFSTWQTFSHHQILNAQPIEEKLRLIKECAIERMTTAQLRGYLSGRADEWSLSDIETKWQREQAAIDEWSMATGISVDRTLDAVTQTIDDTKITFQAIVMPSGKASIQIMENTNDE